MIGKLLRILFPEPCPICNNPPRNHRIAPICPVCWEGISPYTGPICQVCGKPLVSQESIICEECIIDKPHFKIARGFGLYDGALKKAINLLKYQGIKRLSKPLCDIIFRINPAPEKSLCGVKIPDVDLILPVPLHKKRLMQREFNQSALLANGIGKRLGVKVAIDCLARTKNTIPQVGLSGKERRQNLKGAFEVRNKNLIQGKTIMLIDDVFTTGATVRECSKVLKKSGAGDIYVITLADSGGD